MPRELLYGRNAVWESLRAGRRQPHALWYLQGSEREPRLREVLALAQERGLRPQPVDRHRLSQMADDRHHQGVLLETSPYPYGELDEALAAAQAQGQPPFVLLLDLLQDPQNLGSLLRTAEAVGVHGVVIPERRAAAVTPAVVNASAGAAEWLAVIQATNLAQAMAALKGQGVWLLGLEDAPGAQPFHGVRWPEALGLVVGSEGEG
ncbi:MAG: RNA methyltransferase, partial [Chloroflexi bacterium]|nr:RNA methyltransferase [Chloroflexota bacterium]